MNEKDCVGHFLVSDALFFLLFCRSWKQSRGDGIKKPRKILIGVNYCLDIFRVGPHSRRHGMSVTLKTEESKLRGAVLKLTFSGPPLRRLISRFCVVENGERCEHAFHRQGQGGSV